MLLFIGIVGNDIVYYEIIKGNEYTRFNNIIAYICIVFYAVSIFMNFWNIAKRPEDS